VDGQSRGLLFKFEYRRSDGGRGVDLGGRDERFFRKSWIRSW